MIENSVGRRPSERGLRPKMGRSQYVKISPGIHTIFFNANLCSNREKEIVKILHDSAESKII